jgi:hypothetical protein
VHAAERLSVALSGDDADAWREALAAHLEPIGVALALARVDRFDPSAPGDGSALAHAFVDVRADRVVVVLLTRERGTLRVLERGGRSDAVLREEVGLVLSIAAETLLEGTPLAAPRAEILAELGIPPPSGSPPTARVEPEPTLPAPVTPRPGISEPMPAAEVTSLPGYRLVGALLYEGQGYAEGRVIVHGPGIALALCAPDLTLSPGVELFAQFRIPYEEQSPEAGFSLTSGVLRLLATGELFTVDPATMRLGVGGGIDVLRIAPFALDGEAVALPPRTRVAPAVRIGLGMSVRLVSEVALEIGASGDIDVIGTRYVVQRGETIEPLIEPLRFRPALAIGLSTTLAGASRVPNGEEP